MSRPERKSPGETICGEYVVESSLGAGSYGEVYLAERDGTKGVAVKAMFKRRRVHGVDIPDSDIFREVFLLRWCEHPNVIELADFYLTASEACTVMPVASRTLGDYLGVKAPKTCLEMMVGVCRGLDHMHRLGVLHLDIKPENILIVNDVPKIADFGASLVYSQETVTISRTIQSGYYKAPEVIAWEVSGMTEGYKICRGTDVWPILAICDLIANDQTSIPSAIMRNVMTVARTNRDEELAGRRPKGTPLLNAEEFQEIVKYLASTWEITTVHVREDRYTRDPKDHAYIDKLNYIYYHIAQPPLLRTSAGQLADVLEGKFEPELSKRIREGHLPASPEIKVSSAPGPLRGPKEKCVRDWLARMSERYSEETYVQAVKIFSKLPLESKDLEVDAAACLVLAIILTSGSAEPSFPSFGSDFKAAFERMVKIANELMRR